MNVDLTKGNIRKQLFWFSMPLLASVAFQQFYQMADSIIVGQFAVNGELKVAAVGASFPVTQLFIAVAQGINIGSSVLVSQLFGAKRNLRLKSAISTSVITTTLVALVLTLVAAFACENIMGALHTPPEVMADGVLYLQIYVYGLLFLFLYNVCTGIFNAMGDSRTPLVLLIMSSMINIVLDLIFVIAFHWDVAGVAWATFIAQGSACILALFLLRRRVGSFETRGHGLVFSFEMLRRQINYALPSIAQQSFISVGNLIVQFLVNSCGAAVIAGYSASTKISTFGLTCCMAFSSGLSSFTAQNIGAGQFDRVKQGWKAGATYAISMCLAFTAIFLVFSKQLIGLFGVTSAEAVRVGQQYLYIIVPFYFVVTIKHISDSVLRGAGAMRHFMITTFADLIIRVGLSVILFHALGSEIGIWISWPLGWFLGTGLSFAFFKKGVWMRDVSYL